MNGDMPVVQQLTTTKKSLLDTLFIDKDLRRPVYAALTHDGVTSLYAIDQRGYITDVATIRWEPPGQVEPVVVTQGRELRFSEYLVPSKTLLGSSSRTFTTGDLVCKWKISQFPTTIEASAGPMTWTCNMLPQAQPSSRPSSSRLTLPSLPTFKPRPSHLATLVPPQFGFIKTEIMIHTNVSRFAIDAVVFSGVALASYHQYRTSGAAGEPEWRRMRSRMTKDQLEGVTRAEARGALPPYVRRGEGSRSQGEPSSSSGTRLRRPRTAAGILERRDDRSSRNKSQPPPYSSREHLLRDPDH